MRLIRQFPSSFRVVLLLKLVVLLLKLVVELKLVAVKQLVKQFVSADILLPQQNNTPQKKRLVP